MLNIKRQWEKRMEAVSSSKRFINSTGAAHINVYQLGASDLPPPATKPTPPLPRRPTRQLFFRHSLPRTPNKWTLHRPNDYFSGISNRLFSSGLSLVVGLSSTACFLSNDEDVFSSAVNLSIINIPVSRFHRAQRELYMKEMTATFVKWSTTAIFFPWNNRFKIIHFLQSIIIGQMCLYNSVIERWRYNTKRSLVSIIFNYNRSLGGGKGKNIRFLKSWRQKEKETPGIMKKMTHFTKDKGNAIWPGKFISITITCLLTVDVKSGVNKG